MKQLQIGVMGSAADLTYSKDAEQIAEKIGQLKWQERPENNKNIL